MSAVIFSGNNVKTLKRDLLFGEAGIDYASIKCRATYDPTVLATEGNPGSFLIDTTTSQWYKKLDSGTTTNWSLFSSGGGVGISSSGTYGLSLGSPYNLQAADDGKVFILSVAGTLNLHAATTGFKFSIIDNTGTLSTSKVTVVPNGAQKIRGLAANYLLEADYARWDFFFNGTDWFIG